MATEIKRYENDADVHMRLASTYIRYKGVTYFCEHGGGMNVALYTSKADRMELAHQVSANDPELDISSVPLGYCNLGRGPVYLAREAARRQKQGVSLMGIVGFDERSRQWLRPVGKAIPIPHNLVIDTINGKYPSLDEVLRDHNKVGAAFHRRVCLLPLEGNRWKIKYMANFVGILSGNTRTARLVNSHQGNSFLRSILEMRGVMINGW